MSRSGTSLLFASVAAVVSSVLYYRSKATPAVKEARGSNWKPMITIDTDLIEDGSAYSYFLDEVREGSITPTTFSSREYTNPQAPVFREIYDYSGNSVTRFGINSRAINSDLTFVNFTATGTSAGVCSGLSAGAPTGSSRHSTKRFVATQVDEILHTIIETDALNTALEYLLSDDSIKTVLVDIIERDGKELKTTNGIYKTHSVVLYKNPIGVDGKYEIIVIDPSNSAYSWHLENTDAFSALTPEVAEKVSSIRTYHQSLQIYKADTKDKYGHPIKLGPGSTDFRDCVDIAVKIGLGLNMLDPANLYVNIDEINEHPVVIALSNNDNIDNYLIAKVKGVPVRLKQTSNVEIVKKFTRVEITTVKLLEVLKSLLPDEYKEYESGYKVLVSNSSTPSSLSELLGFTLSVSKEIKNVVRVNEEELTKMLGELGGGDD